MLINRRFPFLAPEPAAGGGAGETMEVDLPGGLKVTLPKADAQKVIAARDTRNAEHRALSEEVGAIRAAKIAAEEKAAAEARRVKEVELAGKGEVDELRKLMTGDKDRALAELNAQLLRLHVENAVATNPRLVPEARGDAISLLMSSGGFALDGGKLKVVGQDGRPVTDQAGQAIGTDVYIASWLEKRPHYLRDKTPNGSGIANDGKPPGTPGTISQADYDAAISIPGKSQEIAQQIAAKKLVIQG